VQAKPSCQYFVVELGEVLDGEVGVVLEAGDGDVGGDAEDAEACGAGGVAAGFGVFDNEAVLFFEGGVVGEVEEVEGFVVAFGFGFGVADVFDGNDGGEVVAEFEGIEGGEDFFFAGAGVDGARDVVFFEEGEEVGEAGERLGVVVGNDTVEVENDAGLGHGGILPRK